MIGIFFGQMDTLKNLCMMVLISFKKLIIFLNLDKLQEKIIYEITLKNYLIIFQNYNLILSQKPMYYLNNFNNSVEDLVNFKNKILKFGL